jgi:nucleotide-binding universal stress UspA family protein
VTNSVTPRIVVGVDGSSGGDAALAWAIKEARLRAAKLDVIHAWQEPPAVTPAAEATTHDLAALMGPAAERCLETVIRRAVPEGFAGHNLHMRTWVAHGPAGPVLVEAAQDADLLVVGTRGLGAVGRLVLGSVSNYCLHHARCPVVVIPKPAARAKIAKSNSSPRPLPTAGRTLRLAAIEVVHLSDPAAAWPLRLWKPSATRSSMSFKPTRR